MDVFHTGNYIRSHYNFRISGLSGSKEYNPLVSTLRNIYFRGTPTAPSLFLRSRLNDIGIKYTDKPSIHIDTNHQPNWSLSILGSEGGYNPALSFYNTQLKQALGEYDFLYPLFRPETDISDIIQTEEGLAFQKERVDFFLPTANLVIEIDGSQHQSGTQSQRDKFRNKLLSKHSIKTFRITTADLSDKAWMANLSKGIRSYLSGIRLVNSYKDMPFKGDKNNNLCYITAFRFQATLIEALSYEMITFESDQWNIHVNCEVPDEIIIAAIDDLMNWVKLINREQNIPEVRLSRKEEADLSIDISVSRRWDDEIFDDNVINCRSDHFDYFPSHNVEKSTGMDYFYSENSSSRSIEELQQSNLRGILKEIYGYEEFNPGQIDIIENVIQREDTIGILPTGGGKSLCYQLPGILSSGLTLVVCPIKSLMRDQVKELKEIGVHRSASIDSDTSTSDKEEIIRRVKRGKVRFLFVSPERLQVSIFRDKIKALYTANLLNLIVIDEVHCMSEWGHDFRTSYLTLPHTLGSVAKRTTKLCLTATASKKVLDDIQNEFSIDSENIKTLSLYERKNLNFSIVECEPVSSTEKTVKERLENHLIDSSKGAIIFTPFVNGPDGALNLYHSIKALNAETGIFTGKKPKELPSINYEEEKKKTQKSFNDNKLSILVATKAFGMGVNKKNVYTTIHSTLPTSVESLYQEAGRAGRDKTNSDCFVFYKKPSELAYTNFFEYRSFKEFAEMKPTFDSGDLRIHHFFIKNSIIENFQVPEVARRVLSTLSSGHNDKSEISSSILKSNPSITQLALYRLSQMGVVQDWTIEDFVRGIYLVDYNFLSIEDHNAIVRDATGEGLDQSELKTVTSRDGWLNAMKKLAEILIDHHLNTRVHSRIESLRTLLYACDTFEPSRADNFREEIESYFTLDSVNDSISDILSSRGSFESIISYLSGPEGSTPLLQQELHGIQKRLFPLRRYIESYPDEKSLSFINEAFMFHLDNNYDTNKLLISLAKLTNNQYEKPENLIFLKQLCKCFNKKKWTKIERSLSEGIDDIRAVDILAEALDSDLLTRKVTGIVSSKIQELAGKLDESL